MSEYLTDNLKKFIFEDEFTEDQNNLREIMSGISEEHYCAGWIQDCEFWLWTELHINRLNPDVYVYLSDQEKLDLETARHKAGGWVIYISDCEVKGLPLEQDGNYFLTNEQWSEYERTTRT